MKRALWWALLACALVCVCAPWMTGCATTREDDPDVVEVVREEEANEGADDALHDLERAFALVRAGKHARARALLEETVPLFDDLALAGTSLEKAFVSDVKKPYRGRPHERVLAATMLAVLDMQRGRCDLAIPALRNAAFLDARAKPDEPSDAILVHALALRCLEQTGAAASDVDRARDDLARALTVAKRAEKLDDVVALATAPRLEVVLDGTGPTLTSDGVHGERARVVPGVTGGESVRIRLESRQPHEARGKARAARRTRAQGDSDTPVALAVREIEAWSSTQQATTVGGRPFDEVLAQRAQKKSQASAEGNAMWTKARETALTSAPRGQLDPKKALASAIFATSGLGMTTIASVTDARADTRAVRTLFERAVLVAR